MAAMRSKFLLKSTRCLNFVKTSRRFVVKTQCNSYSEYRQSNEVYFSEFGDPRKVLSMQTVDLPTTLDKSQVLVKMLIAPFNPSDMNMIEGTYHVSPNLPAVVGNEGVGEILEVGDDVKSFSPGDWVLPADTAWGTWRQFAVTDENDLQKIDNDIPALSAATLAVNPCTAYRMLNDYVHLDAGDTIIQNGANSAVGQCVIQLANTWGIKTINVVRERPEFDLLENELKTLGATHVIKDTFFHSKDMKGFMKELDIQPKLAFNCIGGKSATELVRNLDHNGVMVTYGGMSRKPVTIPTGALIFKEVKLLGYWNTQWNTLNKTNPEKKRMFGYLCDLIREGKFVPPACQLAPLENFENAVKNAMEGYQGKKQVLVIDENYF